MYREETDSSDQLESQFILRLPIEPAKILRGAIRNDTSLKDRVTIKIEKDMRHGEVRVDNWLMSATIVDLPTIIESHKTIDGKRLYKTADICQMLQCKKDDDRTTTGENSPQKVKQDSNKAEKNYLWPHGITPPTKNIRQSRFRKTLKKESVDAPEIKKEVKRLLKQDYECVSMKWEVMNDEDSKFNKGAVMKNYSSETPKQVAEHDIFGEAVSDSEEEDVHLDAMDDSDEFSQNTVVIDSSSIVNNSAELELLSEFTSNMLEDMQHSPSIMNDMDYCEQATSSMSFSDSHFHIPEQNVNIQVRLDELEAELVDLKAKRQQQEAKIESIGNLALRRRFQDSLDSLVDEQMEKENEKYHLEQLRQSSD